MTRIRETRESAEDVLRRVSERSRKRATMPPLPREEPAEPKSEQRPVDPPSGSYSVVHGKRRRDE